MTLDHGAGRERISYLRVLGYGVNVSLVRVLMFT